jgi:hypothetical protein
MKVACFGTIRQPRDFSKDRFWHEGCLSDFGIFVIGANMRHASAKTYAPSASRPPSFAGMRTDRFDPPPFKSHIVEDIQNLESRIEILERGMEENIAFGKSVMEGMEKMADRHAKSYEQLAGKATTIEEDFYFRRIDHVTVNDEYCLFSLGRKEMSVAARPC